VEGKGHAALEASTGLSICFGADVQLESLSIDSEGTIEMKLTFADLDLNGSFFGYPIDLRRRNGVTTSYADDTFVAARTAANQRFIPPDEHSFDAPIYFTIAQNGVVKNVQHEGGFGQLFATLVRLAIVDFPASSLQIGDIWESEFNLNLPGIKAEMPVHVNSTLSGEDIYWGRPCQKIDQIVLPREAQGSGAEKVLDRLTGGTAPRWVPSGIVTTYFDLNYGKLVNSEMDLYFDLEMGDDLKAVADLLRAYIGLLDELEGGQEFDFDRDTSEAAGLHVTATLTLK